MPRSILWCFSFASILYFIVCYRLVGCTIAHAFVWIVYADVLHIVSFCLSLPSVCVHFFQTEDGKKIVKKRNGKLNKHFRFCRLNQTNVHEQNKWNIKKKTTGFFFSICHAQRQANTIAGYMLTFQLSYSWHGSYQLITYWLVRWQHKVLAFLWNAFHNAASFQQLTIIAHNLNAFNLNINTVPYLMTAHFTQSQNELGIYSCC